MKLSMKRAVGIAVVGGVCILVFVGFLNQRKQEKSIDLTSDKMEASMITFDDMVEEIAFNTGNSTIDVTDGFIDAKAMELSVEQSREQIVDDLMKTDYIVVHAADFPTLNKVYQPRGLSFYGEGKMNPSGGASMNRIRYVTFDRRNALTGMEYPTAKVFHGNVFINFVSSENIYYSVEGDFFDDGITVFDGRVNCVPGEQKELPMRTEGGNHQSYAYLFHTGEWLGK